MIRTYEIERTDAGPIVVGAQHEIRKENRVLVAFTSTVSLREVLDAMEKAVRS